MYQVQTFLDGARNLDRAAVSDTLLRVSDTTDRVLLTGCLPPGLRGGANLDGARDGDVDNLLLEDDPRHRDRLLVHDLSETHTVSRQHTRYTHGLASAHAIHKKFRVSTRDTHTVWRHLVE